MADDEVQHEKMEIDWEEVDTLSEGLDSEKNVWEWLDSLSATEKERLSQCTVGILSVWSNEGEMACFRIGWRVVMAGLLEYSQRIVRSEMKADDY